MEATMKPDKIPARNATPRLPWLWELAAAMAIVGVCTIVAVMLRAHLPEADLIMIFLVGVVVVAALFRRHAAIVASVASVVSFDFFCVKPYLSFWVSSVEYG